MDESTLKIKEYMDQLPPAVRQAVASAEWTKRIGEIAQKYSLHLDQISLLEYETLFVMIGMEPQEDFVANIQKEVGVSNILAGQLAEEINERIFKSILKSIEEKTEPKAERFEKVDQYVVGEQAEVINQNPALTEIENVANSMPAGGKTEWAVPPEITVVHEIKPVTKLPTEIKHEPKIVEPPVNLPGMEEEITSSPASLADTKLAGITESKTETKIISDTPITPPAPPTPPVTSYTSDPYREPIE